MVCCLLCFFSVCVFVPPPPHTLVVLGLCTFYASKVYPSSSLGKNAVGLLEAFGESRPFQLYHQVSFAIRVMY